MSQYINYLEVIFIFIAGFIGDIIVHYLALITKGTKYGFAQGLLPYYKSLEEYLLIFNISKWNVIYKRLVGVIQGGIWGGIATVIALLLMKLFMYLNDIFNTNMSLNNKQLLYIVSILGSLIIVGYIRLPYVYSYKNLWSNMNKNNILKNPLIRIIYSCMIPLCFICGIYTMYYLVYYNDNIILLISVILFLSASLIWAVNPFFYSNIILFIVAISNLIILIEIIINKNNIPINEYILAIISTSILFIQTFVFDFLIWNGYLFI